MPIQPQPPARTKSSSQTVKELDCCSLTTCCKSELFISDRVLKLGRVGGSGGLRNDLLIMAQRCHHGVLLFQKKTCPYVSFSSSFLFFGFLFPPFHYSFLSLYSSFFLFFFILKKSRTFVRKSDYTQIQVAELLCIPFS